MNTFHNIVGPQFDLAGAIDKLISTSAIVWHGNQIGITTLPTTPDDTHIGTGSLFYQWEKGVKVGELTDRRQEADFTYLATPFHDTPFQDAIEWMKSMFTPGRVRLMRMEPHRCLSWHVDEHKRLHYPIQTNPGAKLVVEEEARHLPVNQWCLVDTTKYHTAFNGGEAPRVHLVASIISEISS